jgi:hypothetical protein
MTSPKMLLDLGADDCLWAVTGDRAPYGFCGERRAERSPYCGAHSRIAYNKTWTPRAAIPEHEQRAATREMTAIARADSSKT